MPSYSKQKLLILKDIFAEETDSDHGIQMHELRNIIKEQFGTKPDRKTIVSDVDALENYGLEIQRATGSRKDYRLFKGKDDLDLMELKILIDLIQSSRFLTPSISKNLIRKLERLCSKYERKKLKREIIVPNREKSENASILYVMDSIHEAIETNKQIRFKYYDYDMNKEKYYHHWGNEYRVSPYALLYRDGIYMLIAIPAKDKHVRMYRVDHMESVTISYADRLNQEIFDSINTEEFVNGTFGMCWKTVREVTLLAHFSLVHAVMDKFGADIELKPENEEEFIFTVPVTYTPEFLGWVLSFGGRMKIVAPSGMAYYFKRTCRACLNTNRPGHNYYTYPWI